MDDDKIISKYLKYLVANNPSSLKLNDDVFFDKKKRLIVSTDTYNEKIHFKNIKKPDLIIKKIIRSSISDLICKGVKPRYIFLSASINNKLSNHSNFLLIVKSLKAELKKYKLLLSGGDTTYSRTTSFTVTVIGFATNIVKRNNSNVGDAIFVTGNLGDAYVGLKILNKNIKSSKSLENYFIKKYYVPDISYKIYKYLPSIASSSIDISDGLILDLERMINNQNLGYTLSMNDIPISKNLQRLIKLNSFQKEKFVSNGDDYQVLFTSPLKKVEQIKKLSKRINIKITKIGSITTKSNQILNSKGNYLKSVKNKGYLHKFK
ncbi:thiamine-phosphate kinase [Candidatus Pelagibacter sp.]|nr:thiamine-phosphate kinase [Candidatus Pelagibacter sp.]